MNSFLETRVGRFAAAIVSGLMFYFVFGLNPYWLAAWLAPIPLLLAAFHGEVFHAPDSGVFARGGKGAADSRMGLLCGRLVGI